MFQKLALSPSSGLMNELMTDESEDEALFST
jgi:hypothetical protein